MFSLLSVSVQHTRTVYGVATLFAALRSMLLRKPSDAAERTAQTNEVGELYVHAEPTSHPYGDRSSSKGETEQRVRHKKPCPSL
jgi:hypothetical protein